MDRVVAVVCGELMQISLAFSAYYPLCSGGPPCAFAEAVERLIRRAASARGAEELIEVMEGRVRLGELGLPDRTRRWRPSLRSWGLSRVGSTPPSSASTSACTGGAA